MTFSSLTHKTVLIFHESSDVQERFCEALKDAGHKPVCGDTQLALLQYIQKKGEALDLLLLNLNLIKSPDETISQSIKKIGADGLPMLIFSGSISNAREIRELADVGITNYINEHSTIPQIIPSLTPHLFPNNFDRRTSIRVVLNIPITYKCESTIATALTLNISKGGLGIRTINPVELESKVELRFRLPGYPSEIEATSRVAWNDKQVGMGLQFEQVDSTNQSAIDEFIDQQVLN